MAERTDTTPRPGGVRARARAALLADVGRIARRHLAERGASELSVRAISREMDLAPSALYRYYPSRDALLTQLIIESYDDLGDHVESAERQVPRPAIRDRYLAAGVAIRDWGIAHPHEYALIYGSPVPGYAAPDDTIGPATRVIGTLVETMRYADPGRLPEAARGDLPPALAEQVDRVIEMTGGGLDPDGVVLGVIQWATLFGMVSFELFGTFQGTFEDASLLYRRAVEIGADLLGLPEWLEPAPNE